MKRARLGLLYGLLVLILAANATAILQRERIGDWWALRGYMAPAEIAALATQTSMTDAGRHLFYINRPELEDKAGFNADCSGRTEHSVVLGCYHGNRRGIYIYNVQDARLDGVVPVTAAHEMLHQAYDRLDGDERKRIDGLLQTVADSADLPQRIKDKLALYRESDAASLPNEMHSIFGTEVVTLPVELETYYAQYFNDRAAVVALSDKYQAEFADRKAKVEAYDAQLTQLNTQIEANRDELEQRKRSLNTQRSTVQALLAQGETAAYRTGATAYNKEVGAYNALIDQTQSLISQYNQIVEARNAISSEEQELQQALDSRQETAPNP
jgi:hypothetical protein